ncbi:hypothetical protein SAMN05444411_101161 [Lutibacter oricola]|uniref:Lipocalin-like domain-containing protein n=1 Tax=Lutibacter oricola TaxID=762486 RepID=A0A1H2R6R3_9FLAO|nr:hypothetical protein [Lutibacter oricola]SDW14908.1 hypothetical protein SAMN05444411_101161 [Lutibacter oricola]
MKKLIVLIIIICSISAKAQKSKIIGNWQLVKAVIGDKTETDLKAVFIFEDKGVLKAARSATSKIVTVGTWKYNKKKKTIVMNSSLDKDFNGEASVIKSKNKELVYKKDKAILSFVKIKMQNASPKIKMEKPILSFKREAMYNKNGDFNYEEEEAKLPWKIETIVNNLKNYTELVYNITSFPDEQEPDAWVVSEKINYNATEKSIDVREYSYFQNDYIDMTENPIWMNNLSDYEYDYNFFPKDNVDTYKVLGTEEIKTPAGTFNCTVVEGFGQFDSKIKYWMITEKPGVFAKIIKVKDAPVPFGSTNVYILKEIKN